MKILWPFDPFDKNKKLRSFGKNLLNNLFDEKDYVEAIYVASNVEVQLATAFNIPVKERYSEYPKKMIKDQLKKLSLEKVKVEVLSEKSLSLTTAVNKVVEYSKSKNIDLIVMATNAKPFLPRVIFGSFAETLAHLSLCDVLIYHQKTKFKLKVPANVIYAHDFSVKGVNGLEKVLKYVKKWNSLLTIVHVPIPAIGMDSKKFEDSVQKNSAKLEKLLERKKIKFKIHFEYSGNPISEVILDIAEKANADIIAVTAQSDKVTTILGGSVTRQILRESLLPTLVLKV